MNRASTSPGCLQPSCFTRPSTFSSRSCELARPATKASYILIEINVIIDKRVWRNDSQYLDEQTSIPRVVESLKNCIMT